MVKTTPLERATHTFISSFVITWDGPAGAHAPSTVSCRGPRKGEEGEISMECIFPPCPKCEKGHMIPFSMGHDVFELWKCTNCTHIVYKKT
jgi:hypothetical protein